MLKRILGTIAPAVVGLSLAFTGCVPGDITLTQGDEIPAIKGPSNVKATAYDDGVIRVTWDPALDAKSYDVYRRTLSGTLKNPTDDKPMKDTAGKDIKTVETNKLLVSNFSRNAVFYDDIVSYDNQLQHGAKYEYIIVANSGLSTSSRNIDVNDIVLNASSKSNSVEAVLKKPAGATLDPPQNVTLDGYTHLQYDSGANFVMSWDNKPGYIYEIVYIPSNGIPSYTGNGVSTVVANTNGTGLTYGYSYDPRAAVQFPSWYLSSITDKVEIRAKFATDYFFPSVPVEKAVDNAAAAARPKYEPDTSHFFFTATSDDNSSVNVALSWEKPGDASSYAVYKRVRNGAWAEFNVAGATPSLADGTVVYNFTDTSTITGYDYQYAMVLTGTNNGKYVVIRDVYKTYDGFSLTGYEIQINVVEPNRTTLVTEQIYTHAIEIRKRNATGGWDYVTTTPAGVSLSVKWASTATNTLPTAAATWESAGVTTVPNAFAQKTFAAISDATDPNPPYGFVNATPYYWYRVDFETTVNGVVVQRGSLPAQSEVAGRYVR